MDGLLDGSESLISGITSGIGGLVTKPFEEVSDVMLLIFQYPELSVFLLPHSLTPPLLFPSLSFLQSLLSFVYSVFIPSSLFSIPLLHLFASSSRLERMALKDSSEG